MSGTLWTGIVNNQSVFRVTLQDSTHRALSNIRVQSMKDQYLSIFNNPFIGTFKFRVSDYKFLMCNPKTLDIVKQDNTDDLYFNNIFHSKQQFETFLKVIRETKRVEGYQFLIDDGNGDQNWGLISARYYESQGFVEGILMDISEQYNQMIELQRANSQLDNFTYHASHDMRAPLTTILGLVNLGLMEDSIENSRSYFEMIRGRVDHLDLLLKDLVSISYNNKANIEYQIFNFTDEVQSILSSLQGIDNTFDIKVDITQCAQFVSDPARLRTILRNLLSNSFKHSNPTKTVKSIELKVRIWGSHAAIQLQDNGIGIEWEYKEKIYDMFFRATTLSEGTGLGLYIVKSMIETLHGNIAFESTLHEGTTFLLIIPNKADKNLCNLQVTA